jgi:hypothetical protein
MKSDSKGHAFQNNQSEKSGGQKKRDFPGDWR